MGKRDDDVNLSPSETRSLARGIGVLSIVIAALCLLLAIALWRPLVGIYDASHPWALTLLEIGVWFAITAWLCFVPPFHGLVLLVGGIVAAFVLWNANHSAFVFQEPWPVALGALIFTGGGLFVMLVSKISTEKHFRRPYWQEARPGAILALAGVAAALLLNVALPAPPVWVPRIVIPAEGL